MGVTSEMLMAFKTNGSHRPDGNEPPTRFKVKFLNSHWFNSVYNMPTAW